MDSGESLARMLLNDSVTVRSAAAKFSVSAMTAAKWVGRYRQCEAAGLADRSSRPHHSSRQISSLLVEKVVALRRLHHNGWRIAHDLGLSRPRSAASYAAHDSAGGAISIRPGPCSVTNTPLPARKC